MEILVCLLHAGSDVGVLRLGLGLNIGRSLLVWSLGFRNHSELPVRMHYAFASGLGNWKDNLFLWVLIHSLHLDIHLAVFLLESELLIKISGFLAGL